MLNILISIVVLYGLRIWLLRQPWFNRLTSRIARGIDRVAGYD
jgi:hypothetical protein